LAGEGKGGKGKGKREWKKKGAYPTSFLQFNHCNALIPVDEELAKLSS